MTTERAPIYVHVGLPKTGTTFLQRALRANRADLRRSGFWYPGPRVDHFFPALDLMQWDFLGHRDERTVDAWPRLVARLREWHEEEPRPALISHEVLAAATDGHVDRLVNDLGFADVHVVLTMRDPARQLVATWQEGIKNRGVMPFRTFFDRTVAGAHDPASASTGYWPYQDGPGILARWARHLPPSSVHVATSPNPSGSGDLWSRFLHCLSLDPDDVTAPLASANASLGVVETQLLIELNRGPAKSLDWPTYERKVKFLLANDVLGARGMSVPITLMQDEHAWASEQAQLAIDAVSVHAGDLQGSVDDLRPAAWADTPSLAARESVRETDVHAAALDAIVGLLDIPDPEPPQPPPAEATLASRLRRRLRRRR